MQILFVCKHNRFRSKIAEAYFKKINKKIKVSSAGLIKGIPVSKKTIRNAKKFGINMTKKTKGLDEKSLLSQDIIIIVANNVPKSIFKRFNKKLIVWKLKDANAKDTNAVSGKIKEIMKKVERFVKGLEKK